MAGPGEGAVSPEQQMNKLREQARSGGAGGGWRPSRTGGTNVSLTPHAEKTPEFRKTEEKQNDAGVMLELAPDANDKDMEELLWVLQTQGFPAAIAALDRINNPHIEDDFHRLLVQYKRSGNTIPKASKSDPLYRALDFVLLEIAVPETDTSGNLAQVCGQMEQFYQSVIPFASVPDPILFKDWRKRQAIQKEHFTMEVAVSHAEEAAVFYMAVPRARRDAFEKQVFANFPRARVIEQKDDYNPFNQFGHTEIAFGTLYRPAPLPIKTAGAFNYEPMNTLLSAFSKITKEGEGAAIQIQVAGAGEYYTKRFRAVLDEINKGKEKPTAIFRDHLYLPRQKWWRRFFPGIIPAIVDLFKTKDDKKAEANVDNVQAGVIGEKIKSIISGVNIRIVTSARTKERAEAMMVEFEQAFGQYERADGNMFKFRKPETARQKRSLLRSFIFRTFDRGPIESFWSAVKIQFTEKIKSPLMYKSPAMPMNLSELATLFHLTIVGGTSSREAKTAGAKYAPAVAGAPGEGLLLGHNRYSNIDTQIFLTPEDRLRHLYVIGQTGTGKTTLLKEMIVQDIENGEGVCFIDPHGVDVLDILSRVPKERFDDLIYFDPAYLDRPMGLNMLEYDPRYPEQKTFVVDEMFKIFQKLYGAVPEAFGPIFEQYFRNAAGLVVEDPETGSTLMDISRVLADDDYRRLKLSRSRNPVINHFWEDVAEQVRGEGDLRNVVPYITSKFDIFISNEIMRPIVGQQRSAFDFKDIMDNKKILLVNLSKGRLGDINANLIGLVLVGKIMMAALARAEYLHQNPPPFYLYLDEFQNVTTDTIATILSEARKYRLSLTIAHQFINQLTGDRVKDAIRNAVFGNVGSMAVFRVGPDDSKFLEPQFAPAFSATDMLSIENYHACMKLLANGKPFPPFTLETYPFRSGDFAQIDALKQLSYQRYGRARASVEAEIEEKYNAFRGK